MCKLCIFAGTTEGRELAEFLSAQEIEVTACVATEYGQTLLEPAPGLEVLTGRLQEADMEALFARERFSLVVDATHPYAPIVTENIANACRKTGTEYLRLLREDTTAPEDSIFVENIREAAAYLAGTAGNILLTTGSKELALYTEIPDFGERVYARVLPMENSLRLCREAQLPPAHIIAMQGPFTKELNVAMLRSISARYMVTKESGRTGGFDQKIDAAREVGAKLVVIGRPPQREGCSYREVLDLLCQRFGLKPKPQVTVVGIGPGNREAMTGEVLTALREADCLIGARRMLEAVAEPGKPACNTIAPEKIAAFIHENPQYRRFAVAMSGDVGFFSGTKKLLPLLDGCTVRVLPGISSMVCLCARLGRSYENVVPVSLHGRDHNLLADIRRNRQVFTLVGGENSVEKLCRELVEADLGEVWLGIGERLGYEDERITTGFARELLEKTFQSLAVVLIENRNARDIVTQGLPDSAFQRGEGQDGVVPMTKSEVRAVALSKLRLTGDSVCWDVGAGTGSVAIEMALLARDGQVCAIEKKEAALDLLRENCRRFGTDRVSVISGTAPEACRELPAPTHVFIGGSSGNVRQIIELALDKNPRVRIVATAIALESVAELTDCLEAFPFGETEVVCLTAARDRKAGRYHLMTGQNPIYIFTMEGKQP